MLLTGKMLVTSIDERAVKRLRQAGGVEVQVEGDTLQVSVMGGAPIRFRVEQRPRLSDKDFDIFVATASSEPTEHLLITRSLSPTKRETLTGWDISWVEYGTGVVHLRAPGLAVDLPEEPDSGSNRLLPDRLPALEGKAGVVVEVLLELVLRCQGESTPSEHVDVDDEGLIDQSVVARLSGSNQGWVSRIFSALVEAGVLDEVGAGPYKRWRVNAEQLLDLWTADGGPEPRVTRLYVWARGWPHLMERIGTIDALPYAVGGVAAADLYAPTLTERPEPHIWIPASAAPEAFARALEGEVVESGANVTLWQASGDPALTRARQLGRWGDGRVESLAGLRVVSPPRAVVEAAGQSGRAREVSERLWSTLLRGLERHRG